MTAETDLLPLYAELQGHPKIEIIKHYARANVAHATAAKDAEIEALRVRADAMAGEAIKHEARAERLAEALQLARDLVEDWAGYAGEYFQKKHNLEGDLALLDAYLHDRGKGESNAP